jgi:DNA-binding NarL/FixJ family response regulator
MFENKNKNKNKKRPSMKIAIADDHEIVRTGLSAMLNSIPDYEVIIEASSGDELLSKVLASPVDLIILDQAMPGVSGLDVLERINRQPAPPSVVLLTGSSSSAILKEALKRGAVAVVSKSGRSEELLTALEVIERGDVYVSPDFKDYLAANQPLDTLTSREMQILLKILEGHSSKAIGEQLNVSFKTIDTHRTRLMNKLDVHSVVELMQMATKWGLVGNK